MNPEFEKRQAQVFELLEILISHAEKQEKLLVFIGGSAIQSILKEPKRLSIDLDLFYSGTPDELVATIPLEYVVAKKKSRDQEMFEFYEATKGDVLVKLDISRFQLLTSGTPYEQKEIEIKNRKVKATLATPDYLLAAKLSSLAIGTIGRKLERGDFQTNLLKDIIDANCLIDEFGISKTTFEYLKQILGRSERLNAEFTRVINTPEQGLSPQEIKALNARLDRLVVTATYMDERAKLALLKYPELRKRK